LTVKKKVEVLGPVQGADPEVVPGQGVEVADPRLILQFGMIGALLAQNPVPDQFLNLNLNPNLNLNQDQDLGLGLKNLII
jgi:hypothetical protein